MNVRPATCIGVSGVSMYRKLASMPPSFFIAPPPPGRDRTEASVGPRHAAPGHGALSIPAEVFLGRAVDLAYHRFAAVPQQYPAATLQQRGGEHERKIHSRGRAGR